MNAPPERIVALGFSPEAEPLLHRLRAMGLVGAIRWPGDSREPAAWLAGAWSGLDAVVAVGACGLVVRLIAPLLGAKGEDPPWWYSILAGASLCRCWAAIGREPKLSARGLPRCWVAKQ